MSKVVSIFHDGKQVDIWKSHFGMIAMRYEIEEENTSYIYTWGLFNGRA